MHPTSAATFAAVLAMLLAAHAVGDHWIQTDRQAQDKGERTLAGAAAAARHVATYTATLAAGLALLAWRCDLPLSPARTVLGLAITAITHYWADRRVHLLALADRIGKSDWIAKDPTALYQLDLLCTNRLAV